MERTMFNRLIGTAVLATAILLPNIAAAQATLACAKRAEIVAFLDGNYAEKPSAIGQLDAKTIVEIFAAESGSWTMMITDVSGRSCVILTGQNWDSIPVLRGPKA
ncbi:hypothetical protein [Rhizobium rhizogenes]|uniref:hypothetical protein n=1 Tax=Rhizobium rhizogenes TaxID=359 RepID=UPI000645E49D|nr:hypothetical protein [Rhizobium rhizogenes]